MLSLSLSVAALTLSVLATTIAYTSYRQQLAQFRKINHFPVVASLFAEFRKPAFHDRYDYVVNWLHLEHPPSCGLSQLPEPARSDVIDQAFFYQTFASLRSFSILDKTESLGNLYREWSRCGPQLNRT